MRGTTIRFKNVVDHFLECPECGEGNLHHGIVHVDNRVTEDGPGVRVTVKGGTTTTRTSREEDFSGRRDDVRITMMCEACGPVADLVIMQHKGDTLIYWDTED